MVHDHDHDHDDDDDSSSSTRAPSCTLHLDHAQSPDEVRQAANLVERSSSGKRIFDSIMVDMSHHPHAENLRLTRELTTYCHERGIAVEAEPGRIEGGEDGVKATSEEMQAVMTTEDVAREFVDCGIDWLAPSFGNVHGKYGPGGIRLDFGRLEKVREVVQSVMGLGEGKQIGAEGEGNGNGNGNGEGGVRLVLHGTDGFTREHYRECIERGGVAKININGVVNARWKEAMMLMGGAEGGTRQGGGAGGRAEGGALQRGGGGGGGKDNPMQKQTQNKNLGLTEAIDRGVEMMQREVEILMDWCGSSGMADVYPSMQSH